KNRSFGNDIEALQNWELDTPSADLRLKAAHIETPRASALVDVFCAAVRPDKGGLAAMLRQRLKNLDFQYIDLFTLSVLCNYGDRALFKNSKNYTDFFLTYFNTRVAHSSPAQSSSDAVPRAALEKLAAEIAFECVTTTEPYLLLGEPSHSGSPPNVREAV